MLLTVIRDEINKDYTGGVLLVDGKEFSRTIEPPVKGNKTHPKGAIPKGWYRVEMTYSPKFKRILPLLRQVPGFEGIRIHAGLKVENTQGCICVGERWKEDHLTKLLTEAQNRREEIYICVTDKDHVDSELPNRSDPYRNCVGY